MPAFINAHEHIYSASARGLSVKGYDPKGFLDILDGMWWTIRQESGAAGYIFERYGYVY